MPEYIYFCTSLPALRYGMEAPLRSEQLLQSASTILSVADYEKLRSLNFSAASERVAELAFFSEYYRWEIALRNQVMQQRLKMVDSRVALVKPRAEGVGSASLSLAIEQLLQQEPYAIERGLDQLRWAKLDELCGANLFNMLFLASYVLKLKILERATLWEKDKGLEQYEKVSQAIKVGEV